MSFEEIRGQEFAVEYIKQAWRNDRLPHAFIFAGPRGVGKTTTALALARLKFCENPDPKKAEPCGVCTGCRAVAEGEHPDMTQFLKDPEEKEIRIGKKEDVPPSDPQLLRYPQLMVELLYSLQRKPSLERGRFVLIQNSEKMNSESGNALLKSIEEPPAGTLFVLTTEDLGRNIGTIISRCHVIRFKNLPGEMVRDHLEEQMGVDPQTAEQVSALSGGSLTRAVELLEKNILAVRVWFMRELEQIGTCDPFRLSERLRELAPGMLHGFSAEMEPLAAPEGSGRTQHASREGLRQFLEMILEFLHRRNLNRGQSAGFSSEQTQEDIALAQEEVISAYTAIGRNVNSEMVVDNLLSKLHNRLTGVN